MSLRVAGAHIQDARSINLSLYIPNSSLSEQVDEAVEAHLTDQAPTASSTEEAAHAASADPAGSLSAEAIVDPSLAPPSMCKKSGASRSRRDPLASLVFVGEALTEMGLIQPRRDVRPSVNTLKGYTSPSPSSSKKLAFFEMRVRTAPTIPGTATKKPLPWRDLDDHAQVIFAFLGLQAAGPVTGFTANLSEAVEAQAYAQPKPGPWLHKRLREQIDKMFGSAIDFVATYEEARDLKTGKRRLHVHGVIGPDLTSRRRAVRARAAMRGEFGTWERPGKGHQIEFTHKIDVGWASYIAKDTRWASIASRRFTASVGAGHLAPSFEGPVVTMTHGTTRRAKAAAERARKIVWEARQRPTAALLQDDTAESPSIAGGAPSPRSQTYASLGTLRSARRPMQSWVPPQTKPAIPRHLIRLASRTMSRSRAPPKSARVER